MNAGWLKLANLMFMIPIALASGIASWFLVFSSDAWVSRMGLSEIKESRAFWVYGAFLLSSAFVVTDVGLRALKAIASWRRRRRYLDQLHRQLRGLSNEEKAILRRYLSTGTRALRVDCLDEAAGSLVAQGIIRPRTGFVLADGSAPYGINEAAFQILIRNPDIVGLQDR